MNLPDDFIIRTKPLLKEEWDNFFTALNSDTPISIRINEGKNTVMHIALQHVPWNSTGYYIDKRPQFTFDPLLHAGCYYVQEASSMFIGQVFKQYGGKQVKVLDLCAAPGGKSTLIADLLDDDSLLVSNEVIRSRSYILAENIMKWGRPNTIVTNNDPADFSKLNSFFDTILVDAPCSGEGMFRKDDVAIAEWSVDNVKLCKERQQRILADIWPALKTGGILIYSTCTYNLEENEENVRWIQNELNAEILSVEIKAEWGISPSQIDGIVAYRFFPHKTKGEGFFCAVLRKNDSERPYTIKNKSRDKKNKTDLPIVYKDYIRDKDRFVFYQKDNVWNAFSKNLYDDLNILNAQLDIVSEGICIGEIKGKDLIPSQSLALSNELNREAFVVCDIDWKTAITYLRKEVIILDDEPKGYILLTYKNVPLGFVKNIGNRANNLYPQEWRIRSSKVPAEIVNVID
ncbi:rRNA cytosine-C5-methyltransferase [Dysgonomonas sp. Marseille-P4677]|uniref:methyltransferase RsmF C-terminal domain-like protein n=1 Tax=Dysgonomonas sp. Marseille-P4677 TaxID=2364790 RepID=UPI0019125901|nr:rRNA cytosine-C5-methyltransferase [Dysgonomonas sp. Marseille-P4677]MBK5721766.1 rRNA cytosine-C5-methyltransferase [Dysgonomonas sp. Marseille-P4677]